MKRRKFILSSLLGSAALSTSLESCTSVQQKNTLGKDELKFVLDELTIREMQALLKEGKYTSEEIVKLYLNRIQQIDKEGPALNSIIEVNPDAVSIARQLDDERKSGKIRGPLHGIPVVIKDNIDTADNMLTTAGSLALVNNKVREDAFIVKKLREAGVILLAKTNLSEWANFRSTRSSSGWSGRGGQTRNPYVISRNPCGSSSGSAVAVSSNLCMAAIGTETDGSIICPSSTNGIVGIKPTLGFCSRAGIIPIAESQDTVGPMARTVTDAAILLGILAGKDVKDAATTDSEGKTYNDYTQFLAADGLKGVKIGVARNFFGFHEKVDALMENVIKILKNAGGIIIDPANIEFVKECSESEFEVLLYEFKDGLNKYLSSASNGIKSLEDVIRFNGNSGRELRYFGQEIMLEAQKRGPLTEKKYRDAFAKTKKLAREDGIDATMQKHLLDVIIAPSGGPAWTTDLINGDHYLGGSSTPAACAGYPSVTVPAGFIEGLPIGVSFIGKAWGEPQLVRYAYAFEQETKHRKMPEYKETIN